MPAFPKHAHTFTESTSPPLGLFIMAALHVCLLIQTNVAWPHLLNQVWLQLLVTVKGWRSVRCCGGRGRDLVWLGSLLLWRTSSHSAGAAEADVAEICNDWKSNVCSRWEVEHSHTHESTHAAATVQTTSSVPICTYLKLFLLPIHVLNNKRLSAQQLRGLSPLSLLWFNTFNQITLWGLDWGSCAMVNCISVERN